MSRAARTLAVVAALAGAQAFAQDASPPPAQSTRTQSPRASAPDAGVTLSPEDREVVENLDLLEHLDESRDLDTLMTLSEVDASGDDDGQ